MLPCRRKSRVAVSLWLAGAIAAGASGCGTYFDPLYNLSYFLFSASQPRELFTPIGADESRVYLMRVNSSVYLPYEGLLSPTTESGAISVVPYNGVTYTVISVEPETGQQTVVREDVTSIYPGWAGGTIALCDGGWLVATSSDAGLKIVDLSTQQEQTLFAGLFNAPGARLASLADGRAVVVSNEFLLVVELSTGQPKWFTLNDLGFIPMRAAVSGLQLAVTGDPLFDPAVDPAGGFNQSLNLYVIELPDGPRRLLHENVALAADSSFRFDVGKVYWVERSADYSLQRVLTADVTTSESRIVASLSSYLAAGDGRTLSDSLLDFGPAGVLYLRQESMSPDLTRGDDIRLAFSARFSIRVLMPDGNDRELRAFDQPYLPLPAFPACTAAFNASAIDAAFGSRLIGTSFTYVNPCAIDVFNGATNTSVTVQLP